MKRLLAFGVAALLLASCGSSPSSPSVTPPPPATPTLTFTPDTTSPNSFSYFLDTQSDSTAGVVDVVVKANAMARFTMFRGTLVFDSAVLAIMDYTAGDFMKQGGAIATFSVTGAGTNNVVIRIDRPDSLPGASGSGTVLMVRFKPATGVTNGKSAIQWTDAHAYTGGFEETLQQTYGGTVTIKP